MTTSASQVSDRKHILDRRFRANPAYEIVLYDRLGAEGRGALPGLQDSRSLFGVLVSKDESLGLKSISRDAALLFYALAVPGPLPAFVREMLGARCTAAVASLVLDGVLEVEHDGRFVSGSAAQGAISDPLEVNATGVLPLLSIAAIRYGQTLRDLDASALAARLYMYNRQPLSPSWSHRYSSAASLAEYLDSYGAGLVRRWLHSAWTSPSAVSSDVSWRHFRSRYLDERDIRLGFKLYVSPRTQELGECFSAFVVVLSEQRAPWFKVGRRLQDVLRPDKMIAYFESFDALRVAADELKHRLEGVSVHGVPFTADLGGDGLLSWGMDPPEVEQVLTWQRRTSWRLRICQRLAIALVAARDETGTSEPWQFALHRLQLDGVDVPTFAPTTLIWGASPPEGCERQ